MKTDDLIDFLSADPALPPDRARLWPFAISFGLGGALVLMLAALGPRPDLLRALEPTAFKVFVSASISALAFALVVRLSKPGRALGFAGIGGALLVALALAASLVAGLDAITRVHDAQPIPKCLVYVPLFALPGATAMGLIMRTLAPTGLVLAGAAIGAASGGIGAVAYALWCPFDNTLAITLTYYILSITICAGIGALVGPRALRW